MLSNAMPTGTNRDSSSFELRNRFTDSPVIVKPDNVRDHRAGTNDLPVLNHALVRLRVHRIVIRDSPTATLIVFSQLVLLWFQNSLFVQHARRVHCASTRFHPIRVLMKSRQLFAAHAIQQAILMGHTHWSRRAVNAVE